MKHVVPTNQSDCLKHLSNSADNDDACTLGNTWEKGMHITPRQAKFAASCNNKCRWLHFLDYKPAAAERGTTSCR